MKSEIKVINNSTFKDKRGYYWTTWKKGTLNKINFNHDKFSMSKKNILRGFHCDFKSWKLLTCVYGELLLVVINVDNNFVYVYTNNIWKRVPLSTWTA